MVTFNFLGIGNETIGRFNTAGSTITTGGSNLTFDSSVTGAGLSGDTMAFTLSPQSAFYFAQVDSGLGLIQMNGNQDPSGTSAGAYTLAFTDGSGQNALANPIADLTAYTVGEAFWITAGGTTTAGIQDNVQFAGTVTGIKFTTSNSLRLDTLSGTLACFAAGSRIATPSGERAVETLKSGDEILTADGLATEVRWLGFQTVDTRWHDTHMQPVRIRAGALGDGLPHSDLIVTADHGMVLNGYVINASALVNHDTIDFVPFADLEDSFIVYHVETEAHDVIIANGAPAETFIDVAGRGAFDNYQEYLDLYGAERIIPDMALPRISSQRLLPEAIRARLQPSNPEQIHSEPHTPTAQAQNCA